MAQNAYWLSEERGPALPLRKRIFADHSNFADGRFTSPCIDSPRPRMRNLTYIGVAITANMALLHSKKRTGRMATSNLVLIDRSLANKMASVISCQKPEVIQDHFGIGIKTWVKIREGQAIRRSVALRLIERLERNRLV